MTNVRRNWWIALGALAVLAAMLVVARLVVVDRRLSEMPEQRAGDAAGHDAASFVSVSIRLRYDALAELLDEQFPQAFDIPEMSLGGRSSRMAVQGSGQVERQAPVAVAGAGDGVVATTRLHASYTLGNALLGTETLQAEADVALATAFDIDEQWKPVVAIQPGFDWIKPPESRLTRMFNLSLAGVAGQQAQAVVGRLEERLPGLIEERFNLSELIHRTWDGAHARIRIAESPAAWLTIQPLGAHFLTPRAESDALLLETGFSASFTVSPDASASPPEPTPLPPLGKQPPPVDGIRISVPVAVDYRTLSDVLTAAVRGQAFAFDLGGPAEVRIDEVKVYPSAPQVVLGLHVDASLPRQWLDTRGWVYLSATPVFDAGTGTLELTDLRFARAVDNRWIRIGSAALNARLVREMQRHARFDLAGPVAQATTAANAMLHAQLQQAVEARVQGGAVRLAERIVVEGGLEGIESATFALAEDGIIVHPVVTGSLAVELVPLYRKPETP